MSKLILYSQPDCHLCEEAVTLLRAAGLGDGYLEVDIETDLELLKRYGILVPVLLREDNQRELLWPFDQPQLVEFLETDQ